MKCPNCQHELKPEKIGSTVYWHCHECGALWFDNKENDFLTLEEAEKLNSDKKPVSFSQLKYSCPRDNKPLKYDTNYYRCYACGGVMASPAGILAEKKDKVNRLKPNLKRPLTLSQLKYVAIFAFIFVFFGINAALIKDLRNRVSIETQAEEVANNIRVQSVNNSQTAIYFSTAEPYRSEAIFEGVSGKWTQIINREPSLNHFLIIETPKTETRMAIKLVSLKAEEYLTQSIEIKP